MCPEQAPDLTGVLVEIAEHQPVTAGVVLRAVAARLSIRAITSAVVTVPNKRESWSTTTPRPDGDDRAASSVFRSVPPSVASVPPRFSRAGVICALPANSPWFTFNQPCGLFAESTTSTQPFSATRTASATVAPSETVVSERTGTVSFSKPNARYPRSRPTKPATKLLAGRESNSAGVASWARMPPTFSTATWSPSLMASSMSWVTKTMVLPSSDCSRRNSCWS